MNAIKRGFVVRMGFIVRTIWYGKLPGGDVFASFMFMSAVYLHDRRYIIYLSNFSDQLICGI